MPSISGAVKRVERRLTSIPCWIAIERAGLIRLAAKMPQRTAEAGHVLLPTVGLGNIGDQAMFEAVLRNVSGPVTAVLQNVDSHTVPPDLAGRVSTVVLPHLYQGRPDRVRHDRHRLIGLMSQHRSVGVIGADIMDGGYDPREATTRFAFLAAANRLGLDTRVYGFSWNGRPCGVVVDAVRATQPATRLYVRDPHSLSRLDSLVEAHGPRWRTLLVTDTVFCLPVADERPEPGLLEAVGSERPVAIVNVSGLVMARADLLEDHVAVVQELLQLGCDVVLVPHVIRPGDDDSAACGEVFGRFVDEPRVRLVDERLTPRAVAWLAGRATVVFTGRMHLAILALSQGVPAVVLATQGKVSGLLELFALDELALEPISGFAESAAPLLRHAVLSGEPTSRVREALPRARELSALNFDGLQD